MGDPIINTQVDAINATLGNIKVDLAALRPSIRAIKDAIAETYLTDTIENVPIASFSDGADEIPVRELQVAINPIQSLNGQTSPYPAGGGANQYPCSAINGTKNELVISTNASTESYSLAAGTVTAYSQIIASETFTLKAGTYCGKLFSSSGNIPSGLSVQLRSTDGLTVYGYFAGQPFTLASDTVIKARCIAIANTVIPSNFSVKACLISGSTAPTAWSPYSNICPISGHTEVKVTRTGVNVWDGEWLAGTYATTTGNYNDDGTSRICSKNKIPCKPNTTYYMKGNCNFRFYDANENFIGTLGTTQNNTFTTPDNCYFMNIVTATGYGRTYLGDISINYPSTDHDYHAYAGQTYPISLGQTVYGGTLNVKTGVLTIDRAMVDLGTLTWTTAGSGRHNASTTQLTGIKIVPNDAVINAICSQYLAMRGSDLASLDMHFGMVNSNVIQVNDSRLNGISYTDFKTAMNGVQLCYELATPTTVQLTAAEVETLFGQNNVWTDTNGNIVKLTYRKAWEIALAEGE